MVTVASEIYNRKLDFENLQGERSYNFFKAYQQSKPATSRLPSSWRGAGMTPT